jgi:hypothetical protein
MTYDLQLGLLATQAMSHLLNAEANQDDVAFRQFLTTSANFCQAIIHSVADPLPMACDATDADAFISAVMKVSVHKSSEADRDRLRQIEEIQPLIDRVLQENRRPDPTEQLQIAAVLYTSSAADFR